MKKMILSLFIVLCSAQLFAQTGLKKGDKAPDFTARNSEGEEVNLKTLIKQHKSVVLFFYRGQWCPYCNKHIKELQDSLQMLTGKGAYVLGITPESNESIAKTREKTKAHFSLISDAGYKIMKAYKVDFIMDGGLVDQYKKYGIDVAKNNGATDSVLPVPATYIIDKMGNIKYVQFDTDYKRRASVKDISAQL